MALRVWLEKNRKMKAYQTWYVESYDGWFSPTYHTKCGMNWKSEPTFEEGCHHIECALKAHPFSEFWKDLTVSFFFIGLGFCGVGSILGGEVIFVKIFGLISGILFIPLGLYSIFTVFKDYLMYRELTELKSHGTINGIEARLL